MNMNLQKRFFDFVNDNRLFTAGDKLLLAVSGGVDSIALCEICKQAGYDFVIAHCNFGLRGAESDRDEAFVRKAGERYKVKILVKHFNTGQYATERKVSVQVAARELRYAWFSELLDGDEPGLSCLLTAHHLDDNIETSLMNFFKGTGIAGLRGILPKQGKLVRPLLFASKEEIIAFARGHNLDWVEDSSNKEDKYSRNYFRNQLIPLAQKIYPAAIGNLASNLQRFRETEWLYQEAIENYKKKLLKHTGKEIQIPVLKLKRVKALHSVVFELTKEFGFTPSQVNELIDLLESETGKYVQSATHRIIRNRNWLIIASNETGKADTVIVDKTGSWPLPIGTLAVKRTNAPGSNQHSTEKHQALLDASEMKFPLLLRKWKQGDYFYPLGMPKKKKKLSRFFIDQKLSRTEKENAWVVEMDKKIVWVVGMRIDERFKLTPKTKEIFSLELKQGLH